MSKVEDKFKLSKREIQKLAEYGGMAPSGGNLQPWKLIFTTQNLEIRIDPNRSNSFLDVGRYASIFALGCLIENISITAESLGLLFEVNYPKYKDVNDTVAKIEFINRRSVNKKNRHVLYPFIPKRVTNRQIHDGTILPSKTIVRLKKIVQEFQYDYSLHARSTFAEKKRIAKILGIADGIRNTNQSALTQLVNEFRWTQQEVEDTRDGIDLKTCELPGNVAKMLNLLKKAPSITKFVPRKALETMAKPLLIGCSHICCLALNDKFSYQNVLFSGRAMQRLWLNATKLGLALQPWSIVPFFMIRVKYYKGAGFSDNEKEELKKVNDELISEFEVKKKSTIFFIFRLSVAKPHSARSLRISWRDYTRIKNNN